MQQLALSLCQIDYNRDCRGCDKQGFHEASPQGVPTAQARDCCTAVTSRRSRVVTLLSGPGCVLPLSDERSDPAQPPRPPPATSAPRLREIPYNYTSFSDREIVIRLLGEPCLGAAEPAARGAPHRPLGPHAVRGAGRHLGGAAQPLSAGRPARQPQAPRSLLVEALHHRLGEVEKRRTPDADAAARRAGGRAAGGGARRGRGVRRQLSSKRPTCAARPSACLRRLTAKDNIKFDGLSRVSAT